MDGYSKLFRIGKLLFEQHLISASAGNISMRTGNLIHITASGSFLGDLRREDVVKLEMSGANSSFAYVNQKKPSTESGVHLSVYRTTDFKAIVHAHTPAALALSFGRNKLEFIDAEGKFYLPEVPVLTVENPIASPEVALLLPQCLVRYKAAVITGHGSFAAADTIEGAFALISSLEFSSEILLKYLSLNK